VAGNLKKLSHQGNKKKGKRIKQQGEPEPLGYGFNTIFLSLSPVELGRQSIHITNGTQKRLIKTKEESPPLMAAEIWAFPSQERNRRSTNIMTVSDAWEMTMGRAIWRRVVRVGFSMAMDSV
jgi:hypothetical protein